MLIALSASAIYAQTITSGDISGVVKDPTGAVVPGATVRLKSTDTGESRTATTNQSGDYRFTTLRTGSYQISASGTGLSSDISKISVSVGQVSTFELTVKPQSSKEIVEVSETTPLVQSDNANLATTFNPQQLENLPAPGNDITAYAFTAPGVTISTGGGYGSFSAFGLPGVSNLFTVNGNDNMDPYLNLNNSGASNLTLGANEIAEAAVVLNGYTGQYGRQAGANVNYVTKTGTNAFHGTAAWYFNERVLNANDWFQNSAGNKRPFSVSNEWAASLGGPVIKNKLFFFVDNEGLRYVLAAGGPVYIPTDAFANYTLGNLAATNAAAVPLYQNIFNLYKGVPGAGRATALSASDNSDGTFGCGQFKGAGFGTASTPCAQTFRSNVNNLNTEWLLNARADYNIGSNDRIYFRYTTDHGVQATGTDPINPAFNANSVQPSYGGQFGYTKVINSAMVNQLNLSASYYTAIFGPPDINASLAVFPTTITFADGLFTDLGGSNNSYPSGRKVRQWQAVDDFSITHGHHTIKFGLNARKNFITSLAYGAGTSGLLTINDINDLANGAITPDSGSTYAQTFTRIGGENLTLYSLGFYGQDEWKLRPNLTVTLAARFDRNSNIQCAGNGCFNELVSQPFGQLDHNPNTPYNAAIRTGLKEAFPSVEPIVAEPRIGIAYSPTSKTVLRGGFGIFSDLYQGLIADRLITNAPAVAAFTTPNGAIAPATSPNSVFASVANSNAAFQNGFSGGATLAQLQTSVPGFNAPNFNTVAKRLYNPKYYEWNFELQQSLTNSVVLSLNYVGNKGYQEVNQTLFANQYSASGFQNLPTAAPDARFGEVRELNSNGFSNYNGFVSNLRWRLSSNFTGSVAYTWGHALDTCSNACLQPYNFLTSPSFRYQVSPANLRSLNYGSADYDVRHSLNANYVYTVPTGHFNNWALKQIVGGWTVAGTFFWKTGYPFSVVDSAVRGQGGVSNGAGIATQSFLAEYTGGLPSTTCSTPNISCFDSNVFTAAADQRSFGNLARNSFRGPGYFNTDLNVNKRFTIFKEGYNLLIGAFFFNVLNHPNFDLPVNNVALSNFGTINSTVSAPTSAYGSFQGSAVSGRVIQLQAKFTF